MRRAILNPGRSKGAVLLGLLALLAITVNARDDSLDARHQVLIAVTETAQGVVAGLTEDEAFVQDMGTLSVGGTFDDMHGQVRVQGTLSFFDVFFDVFAERDPNTGDIALAVKGPGRVQVAAGGTARFLQMTNELTDAEQVLNLDLEGTIAAGPVPGPRPWDCEIVKFFRFFRGGNLITDRGVKIITRNRFIRAKYVEFSAWLRRDRIRRDIIIEKRIFPLPDPQIRLELETSVGQAIDTLNGVITVTP